MRQLILFLLNFVSCLYEDQIGKFDWRKELIGVPLFVAFDVSKGPTKYVSVYSERNVSFLKKVLFSRPGLRRTSSSSPSCTFEASDIVFSFMDFENQGRRGRRRPAEACSRLDFLNETFIVVFWRL